MESDKTGRQPADGRRAPSWERSRWTPYFAVLAIALLLSAACLFLWRQEHRAAEKRLAASLLESAADEVPQAAEQIASVFSLYGEKCRFLAKEAALAVTRGHDDRYIAALTDRLLKDPNTQSVWIFLEPNGAGGKPAFAIRRWPDTRKIGKEYAEETMRGEYYAAARERNALELLPVMKTEPDESMMMLSHGYGVQQKLVLQVDAPVRLGGDFAGVVGFEIDISDVQQMITRLSDLTMLDLFLIGPDGNVAASSYGEYEVESYPDELADYVGRAGDGYGAFVTKAGSFAVLAPIDAGDDRGKWILAGFNDMLFVSSVGQGWLVALLFVWLIVPAALLTIRGIRKRIAAGDETESALAEMTPETAAIFKKLEIRCKACYLLCTLFCLPAVFILGRADKRYQEAKRGADVEAAKKAAASMTPVTVVAVIIGCGLLYLRILE